VVWARVWITWGIKVRIGMAIVGITFRYYIGMIIWVSRCQENFRICSYWQWLWNNNGDLVSGLSGDLAESGVVAQIRATIVGVILRIRV